MEAIGHNLVGARSVRGIRLPPVPEWLRSYERRWVRADVVAGVTLAAYLLPSAIGDASLAGLPPEAGLYACICSGMVFWLFCSSRYTAVSVTSAISALIGASLAGPAGGDVARLAALAACTAVLAGLIALLAWAFRAGSVVSFISESVMVGFKCGVALFLASTQLPKLFGIRGSHGGGFWERMGDFIRHVHETNVPSLVLGAVALGVLVGGKVVLRNRPVALFVVIGGIVAAPLLGLEARGVKLLGEVPGGVPHLRVPGVGWGDVHDLLPLALAVFLLGAVETAAIGRMFVAKHGGRLDSNRELLGIAAANLAAGFGQGFPVSGGTSQSLVNESGGARTPLSGLVAAVIVLLVTVFLSGVLRYLPQPVLAAVVLSAVAGLFQVGALRHLRHADRAEYASAMGALIGVLAFGLLDGVLIGAAISLVLLLRRVSHPRVARLGRIPGTRRFSDCERHPDNELVPGVAIFRPEASLVYFNVEHVRDTILKGVRAQSPPVRLVVLDLSASPYVDLQSAEALMGMAGELAEAGIRVEVVEGHATVRERLRAAGADAKLGRVDRYRSVADVLEDGAV